MSLNHSLLSNLLLNLDFKNPKKFTSNFGTNLVQDATYNAATWLSVFPTYAVLQTGITAPDGTATAIRLTCNTAGASLLRANFNAISPNGTDTYVYGFFVRKISGTTAGGNVLYTDLHDLGSLDYKPLLKDNEWVYVTNSVVLTTGSKSFIDLLSNNVNDFVLDFWGLKLENQTLNNTYIPLKDTVSGIQFSAYRPNYTNLGESFVQIGRSTTANAAKAVTNYIGNGTTLVTCTVASTADMTPSCEITISGVTADTNINGYWTANIINSTTFTFNTGAVVAAGTFTTGLGTLTVSSKWGGLITTTNSTTGNLTATNFLYNDHTWEVWVRIDDRTPSGLDPSEGNSIIACFPGWHCGFLFYSTTIYYYVKNGASLQPTCASWTLGTSGTQVIQGNWHQIVLTRQGNVFTPYVNGSQVGTGSTTVTDPTNNGISNYISIGGSYNYKPGYGKWMYFSKVSVGNMKMYNKALSSLEVLQNFNALRGRYGI